MIIDFHSHVLPGIDDGSRNVERSLQMMQREADQGIEIMTATPHFYGSRNRIENFLEKREASYHHLMEFLRSQESAKRILDRGELEDNALLKEMGLPQLYLGAEVAFFEGVSRADQIEKLTIGGGRLLLLEMPFCDWTDANMEEVRSLIYDRDFHLIIAHIERFMSSGNKRYIEELFELPVEIQVNAESIPGWKGRKQVKLFKKGQAQLLSSDCHGINRRPPNLDEGRAVLAKKLGSGFMAQMDAYATDLYTKEVLSR